MSPTSVNVCYSTLHMSNIAYILFLHAVGAVMSKAARMIYLQQLFPLGLPDH